VIRVLVADDQTLVRAGFRVLVESAPDLEVVGEAGDGVEAVELARRELPDVVLMDIRMPRMDGLEATRRIVALDRTEGVRVLVLTTFDLDEYVYQALRAGASGFLLKDTPPADLLAAIRVVAAGDALLAPGVTRRLIAEFARRPEPSAVTPAALGAMAAISVRGLTRRFGDVLAVDRLDFEVDPGTVTGFLGPNGAGKTTTLRMLLGLVAPTAGAATIAGRPYRELAHPARRVGAVLEQSGFHPGRPARDHLRALAAAAGLARRRVDEVLEQTGLAAAARRRVGGFSLGMRQRLGPAAALLGNPDVLVLDEPANGLDPEGVHWLRGLVRGPADQGQTVLVSSHLLAEVAQTVDQVAIIDRGRLVAQSTLAALTAGADRTVRVRTAQPEALRGLLVARGATVTLDGHDQLLVGGVTAEEVGQAAAADGVVLHEMRFERSNLEDVFLELTGGKGDQP
jgi:ABC-2 type transport system ATP-binding protein